MVHPTLAAFVLVAAVAPRPPKFVWNTYDPGRSIAYGVPETDNRSLRIDCEGGGQLSITGPSGLDLPDGFKTKVRFKGYHFSELRSAIINEADVLQFTAKVADKDPAILALLKGNSLVVIHGAYTWTVPGTDAPRVLGPLINSCRGG